LKEQNPDGTWHYFGFVFRISTVIDLPEREVEDTILHEMIHYYILSNQMQDTSAHGEIFMRMMKDINVRVSTLSVSSAFVTTNEASPLLQKAVSLSFGMKSPSFRMWLNAPGMYPQTHFSTAILVQLL